MKRALALVPPIAALAGVAALLARDFSALRPVGEIPHPYGDALARAAVRERHIADAISGVNLDLRALDTLGEELVLFAAAVGLVMLVREAKEGEHRPKDEDTGALIASSWAALLPWIVLVGALIVLTGQLSPGGGFQGGVLLASAFLLAYLAGRMRAYHAWTQEAPLDIAKAVGAGGLAVVGLSGLAVGTFFRAFLPFGKLHHLLSGGIVPLGNVLVALAVAPGIALLVSDVIDEMRAREGDGA